MASEKGDLSITALYTSATWSWGRLPSAELLATPEASWVFRITNFVLWIARLFRWELPSLKVSLLHRHLAIDRLLADARPTQVLELACGLSRRGAAISASPALQYTEVDLPAVIARKRELFARAPAGQAVLARPNLRLQARDVLTSPLEGLVEPGASLFVIAEGLLMYLNPDQQGRLWEKIRALFDITPGTFVFDLVPTSEQPKPGLVGRLLERLMKLFTGGRSFERDTRSREDIAAGLRAAGFSQVELLDPSTMARAWALPFADVRTQQLLFVCRP